MNNLRKYIVVVLTAICAAFPFFSCPASASTYSFSNWKYLGHITYSANADIYGRTCILFDDNNLVHAYANVHSTLYDSGMGSWVGVVQIPGIIRAWSCLYDGIDAVTDVGWIPNSANASFVSADSATVGQPGHYYLAEGWGQYYYLGDYYPNTYAGCQLITSPQLLYPIRSLGAMDAENYRSTADYLRACGVTEFKYGVTSSGETYGSDLLKYILGVRPDWISAVATNGETGYIDADDYWVPEATCPADFMTYFAEERTKSIPVYAEPDGGEIVGYYEMHYGGFGASESS